MLIEWRKMDNTEYRARIKNSSEEITGDMFHWAGRCYIIPKGCGKEGQLILEEIDESTARTVLRDKKIEIDIRTDSEEEFVEIAKGIANSVGDARICNSVLMKEYKKG